MPQSRRPHRRDIRRAPTGVQGGASIANGVFWEIYSGGLSDVHFTLGTIKFGSSPSPELNLFVTVPRTLDANHLFMAQDGGAFVYPTSVVIQDNAGVVVVTFPSGAAGGAFFGCLGLPKGLIPEIPLDFGPVYTALGT